MLKDVSLGIADRYYLHLTSLQNVFSQVKLFKPLIDTIKLSMQMVMMLAIPISLKGYEVRYCRSGSPFSGTS